MAVFLVTGLEETLYLCQNYVHNLRLFLTKIYHFNYDQTRTPTPRPHQGRKEISKSETEDQGDKEEKSAPGLVGAIEKEYICITVQLVK